MNILNATRFVSDRLGLNFACESTAICAYMYENPTASV